MAQTVFEKIASAESAAEEIRNKALEKQKDDLKNANAEAEAVVGAAKQNAEQQKAEDERLFASESAANKEDAERQIMIKCSLVRNQAGERKKSALDYIFRGVTGSGSK